MAYVVVYCLVVAINVIWNREYILIFNLVETLYLVFLSLCIFFVVPLYSNHSGQAFENHTAWLHGQLRFSFVVELVYSQASLRGQYPEQLVVRRGDDCSPFLPPFYHGVLLVGRTDRYFLC